MPICPQSSRNLITKTRLYVVYVITVPTSFKQVLYEMAAMAQIETDLTKA